MIYFDMERRYKLTKTHMISTTAFAETLRIIVPTGQKDGLRERNHERMYVGHVAIVVLSRSEMFLHGLVKWKASCISVCEI